MLSGSTLKRSSLSTLTAAVLAAVMVTPCLAARIPDPKPEVVRLLPVGPEVKDWEVYPDTLVYASGNDLTEIYDGAFELYTKNGVLDAASQMYRRGDDTATVTIHRMDSVRSAVRFFEYWRRPDRKQSSFRPLNVPTRAYVYSNEGATSGRHYRDRYFVTVETYVSGGKGAEDAEGFMRSISKKIGGRKTRSAA